MNTTKLRCIEAAAFLEYVQLLNPLVLFKLCPVTLLPGGSYKFKTTFFYCWPVHDTRLKASLLHYSERRIKHISCAGAYISKVRHEI